MKLHEKIRNIRKNITKLSLKEFHEKLVDIFGDRALTYYSLCRVEKGRRDSVRLRSLYQISTGLGVSLKDLTEGTDREESKIVSIMRRKDRANNEYIYNGKAVAEILSSRSIRFLVMELVLRPLGATREEQDPVEENNKFEKLVIVLQGEIHVYVGGENHLIKKGDSLSFTSSLVHHFENHSPSLKTRCIIVQNPRSY
ncbi:MAG: cupin domain-containing protein [Candidatus Omnitrophota bacterium]|nr:cupin domain-containing protein [Candidatus Omnitrophota bacterium]